MISLARAQARAQKGSQGPDRARSPFWARAWALAGLGGVGWPTGRLVGPIGYPIGYTPLLDIPPLLDIRLDTLSDTLLGTLSDTLGSPGGSGQER